MKLISWNVRGLGNSRARNALRDLLSTEKPDVLFVSETKLSVGAFERFCRSCGYMNVVAHSSSGASGGVGLCWKNSVNINLLSLGFYYIDVHVLNDGDGCNWRLTGFYGHPNPSSRHESWDLLRALRVQSSLPWLCLGDFNELLWSFEKRGGPSRNVNQMDAFRTAVDDCRLHDIGSHGIWYTWEKGGINSPLVRERLDRALASDEWLELIPDFYLENLVNSHSDHNPICLQIGSSLVATSPARQISRRFCASWTHDAECEDIVRSIWTSTAGSIVGKIPVVLDALVRWSAAKFSGRKRRKKKLKKKLDRLAALDPTDEILHELVEVKTALNTEIDEEEALWAHRAHISWLREGDRNTSVFHRSATQRRRENTIRNLLGVNGNIEHTTDGMLRIAVDYFTELFHSSNPSGFEEILNGIETRVDDQMNLTLERNYTAEEVKTTLFSMGPTKASGPDGMPALFYQKYWSIVGDDVCRFCLDFLNGDTSIEAINGTNVVLIPKITNPESMQHFRPISLSNVLYKIIAKTLANRFKGILDGCIDPAQSAFIPGRLISDNVLIAYELLHTLKNQRDGGAGLFALKMDMSKAYDRVEWSYLEAVMQKMGFSGRFVERIMHCVRSVSYSVTMNGGVSDSFRPTRGIRQGDPLSTYLFLICSEGLSSLLRSAQAIGDITGLKASVNGPSITHLLFADDAIIFGEASLSGSQVLRDLIYLYGRSSGQQVNYDKSLVYFSSNASVRMRAAVKNVLRVRVENNPERYLGLPSMVGRNRTLAFQYLCDRLSSRIKTWTTRFLSYAGREVFIKAVLQSLPTYAMSCFLLPKGLCNDMNSVISRYWWKGGEDGHGMHWVRWSQLCIPKNRGGLGFRDLAKFNIAMLAKQGWRLLTNPTSLVARVLKAKYYPNTSFLDAQVGNLPSLTWRSVWLARGLLEKGVCWRIGNGLSVRAWHDPWIPGLPPVRLVPLSGRLNVSQRVTDFIDLHTMQWDEHYLHEMLLPQDVPKVLSIPLPSSPSPDVVAWQFENTGIYSVRSGYQVLMGCHRSQTPNLETLQLPHQQLFYKKLWAVKLPPKVLHTIWKIFKNFIATNQNRFDRHIAHSPMCVRCNIANESSLHLCRDCPAFAPVWDMLGIQWQSDSMVVDIQGWLYRILCSSDTKAMHKVLITIWANWTNRNQFIYEGKVTTPTQLYYFVQAYLLELEKAELAPVTLVRARSPSHWECPPAPFYKANFDATFDPATGMSSSGIVIRNSQGELMSAASIQSGRVPSPFAAEALACLHALQLADSMDYTHLIFEGDSRAVITYMNSSEVNRSPIAPIIVSCKQLMSSFTECRFQFRKRDCNRCAHTLAQQRVQFSEDMYWIEDSPECIVDILLRECPSI